MSNIGSYTNTKFNESQKFLVLDPSTGSTSLVLGSSLVDYITPNLGYVYAETTRLAAENTDYAIGSIVQTSGSSSIGDDFAATYLVVAAGEGDFPMINGNELLIIKGDEFLREQLISEAAGEGASLVSMEGGPTVETAINNRVIRVGSVAEGFSGRDVESERQYSVADFYDGGSAKASPKGGGAFVGKTGVNKSEHDGIFIISPTVPSVSAQVGANLAERVKSFLDGAGETDPSGAGCFVRADAAPSKVPASWAGATTDPGFDNSLLVIPLITAAKGRSVVYGPGAYEFYTQVNISDSEFRDYGIEGVEGRPAEAFFWDDMTVFANKTGAGEWLIFDSVDSHFGARLKHICIRGEDDNHGLYLTDFRNVDIDQLVFSGLDRPFDIGWDDVGASLGYYSTVKNIIISGCKKGLRSGTSLNGTGFEKLRISNITEAGSAAIDLISFGSTYIKGSWLEGGDQCKIRATDGNLLTIERNWLESPEADLITDNVKKTVMINNECHRSATFLAIIDLSFKGSSFEFSGNRVRNRTNDENQYIDITGNPVDPTQAGVFIGKNNTFIEEASVTPSPGSASWWFNGFDCAQYIIGGNNYFSSSGNVLYRVTKYVNPSSATFENFLNNLTVFGEPKESWPDPMQPIMMANDGGPAVFKKDIVLQSPDGTLFQISVDNAGAITRTNIGSMAV